MITYHNSICMGTGEIGKPLYELINGSFLTLPIDPEHFPENELTICDYLHICIPGNLDNFKEIVLSAALCTNAIFVIIHSTVIPGTTDDIQSSLHNTVVIHAPVHGKHHNNQMKKDMLRYPKYLGLPEKITKKQKDDIINYFKIVGFADIRPVDGSRSTEWLKVLSTTYFGLQIAWAQEVERICDKFNLDYKNVTDFFSIQEDIKPPHYSGQIGGHCVLPNIKIINSIYDSLACRFINDSNELKRRRDNEG